MVAGAVMLLACMMTDAGTPWRRAMVSMVSPAATVIAVPPSQLQLPDDVGLLRRTDPVTSEAAPEFAATDVAECDCGACAVCACGIPAVGAGLLREANGLSLNRVVSAL